MVQLQSQVGARLFHESRESGLLSSRPGPTLNVFYESPSDTHVYALAYKELWVLILVDLL